MPPPPSFSFVKYPRPRVYFTGLINNFDNFYESHCVYTLRLGHKKVVQGPNKDKRESIKTKLPEPDMYSIITTNYNCLQ